LSLVRRIPIAAFALALLVTILAPVAFICWLASPRLATRLDGVLLALASGCLVALALVVGPIWGWIGIGWRWGLVALWAVAAAMMLSRWPRRRWRPEGGPGAWRGVAVKGMLAVLFGVLLGFAAQGFRDPGGSIDLRLPLDRGRYLVVHGGDSPLINAHHSVPAQRHALDIVALDTDGRRAEGLLPESFDAYEIHGRPVYSPCEGTVIDARDGAPDTAIGGANPEAPAGNYATLACRMEGETYTVLIAHLEPGSLAVAAGDMVTPDVRLGRIGSSGNSSEPHLHIHAVRGKVEDHAALIFEAEPVGMLFDGRFLRRNDVVER
jgi:Peptidase family M23